MRRRRVVNFVGAMRVRASINQVLICPAPFAQRLYKSHHVLLLVGAAAGARKRAVNKLQ
jgi:hypothetical protein